MALKETIVAVWSQVEPEVTFRPELSRDNAHARRAPYRVLPADHSVPLDVEPVAFDAVLRAYPQGVEIGTIRGEYAKNVSWSRFSAYFLWAVAIFAFLNILWSLVISGFSISLGFVYLASILGFTSYFLFCFGSYYWRLATASSLDDPVLFNKKTKLVYILPYLKGGFFKFWKSGAHGAPVAYRWEDQIRARIYNYIYFRGANLASEGFELGLLAIREGTTNEVEQLIQLGVQSNGFDSTQLALWEHIRQYMEEDGPPLQPGDKLRATDLSRVPEFPADIVAEAGGPALDQDAIDRLVQLKRSL